VRVIKYRFDEETIAFLEKLKWWDFSEEQLDAAIPYLTSVHLEEAKEEEKPVEKPADVVLLEEIRDLLQK